MLEAPSKNRFSQDRFIYSKNNVITSYSSELPTFETMETEEKSPYEMLISGQIFSNEMIDESDEPNHLYTTNHYMAEIKQLMSKKVDLAPKTQVKKNIKP